MVNPYYTPAIMEQAFLVAKQQGAVQLKDFLTKKTLKDIRDRISELAFKREEHVLTHAYAAATCTLPVLGKAKILLLQHKDYQLITRAKKPLLFLDVTERWPARAGGTIVSADGEGNHTIVPVEDNSLIIVSGNYYITYLNHYAKKRLLILLQH